MAKGSFVSYLRVSTGKQGVSGLGLEAQRETVRTFLNGGSWELVGEFVEVETATKKGSDRPELAKALARCRVMGAVKKNMPRIGGFQSFGTARRTIQGFEAMLWLRKGFGFAGAWAVCEQNRLLAVCFGLPQVNKA